MVDDGGSSGRLRHLLDVLPPGDSRNCINATATNKDLSDIFDFRFACAGELDNHSLGNLIIAGLQRIKGDFKSAVDAAGKLLGSRIEVIPATNEPVFLNAETYDGRIITGQRNIAESTGVKKVMLNPSQPVAEKAALAAISNSDIVLIGPGSLFSSIIPSLLIPEIENSILERKPKIVYLGNIVSHRKETYGMSLDAHVYALTDNCPYLKIDLIVAQDPEALIAQFPDLEETPVKLVRPDGNLEHIDIVYNDLVDPGNPKQHSIEKLSRILADILDEL